MRKKTPIFEKPRTAHFSTADIAVIACLAEQGQTQQEIINHLNFGKTETDRYERWIFTRYEAVRSAYREGKRAGRTKVKKMIFDISQDYAHKSNLKACELYLDRFVVLVPPNCSSVKEKAQLMLEQVEESEVDLKNGREYMGMLSDYLKIVEMADFKSILSDICTSLAVATDIAAVKELGEKMSARLEKL
jgi:hypothetical protein